MILCCLFALKKKQEIPSRFEANAIRLEAIASRLEQQLVPLDDLDWKVNYAEHEAMSPMGPML